MRGVSWEVDFAGGPDQATGFAGRKGALSVNRPRNDFVLVRRVKPEGKIGSMFVPDMAQEKRMETVIIAIGPGAFHTSGQRATEAMSDLVVGQRVMVGKYGGVPVEDMPDHFLVRESEILAVLDAIQPKKEGK